MDLNYREIISGHFHTKISSKLNDFDACDMQCYSESTADGYDVYVLKHTDAPVNLNEDVYYYGNDLAEQIMDAISEYRIDSIYIDEELYDDYYIKDAFEEYFNDNVEEITTTSPALFTKKELKFLWDEHDISIEGSEG
jgi:hypothetical protein